MAKKEQVKSSKTSKAKKEEKDPGYYVPSSEDFDSVRSKVEKRTGRVPCPELNDIFGAPKDKIVTFTVSQCDLSTYLRLQGDRQGTTKVLVGGLLRALNAQDEDEIGKLLSKHFFGNEGEELSPQAKFEVELCRTCVLEPNLERSYWVFLADMFPMIVNRISNVIVDLTLQGGIKKN